MKNLKKSRLIYVVLSVAALIINGLLILLGEGAEITRYSTVSIAVAVCSLPYAVMAFLYKDKDNLFIAGKFWFYRTLSLTFSEKRDHRKRMRNTKRNLSFRRLFIV